MKMNLLTFMSFQTCMTFFPLFWNTKEYIEKNNVFGTIDFQSMIKILMEVNGTQNCLVSNILQNIFFCVQNFF